MNFLVAVPIMSMTRATQESNLRNNGMLLLLVLEKHSDLVGATQDLIGVKLFNSMGSFGIPKKLVGLTWITVNRM